MMSAFSCRALQLPAQRCNRPPKAPPPSPAPLALSSYYFPASCIAVAGSALHAEGATAASSASALAACLPVAVLADPAPTKLNAGVVLSVAPLLGTEPRCDAQVPRWLHLHVRPSLRGLLRVVKARWCMYLEDGQ